MRTKKILYGCFAAAIAAGIGAAIWRTVLMIRYYDPYMKEYATEARPSLQLFGIVLFGVLAVICLTSLVAVRVGMKKGGYEFSRFSAADHQATTFTSALLGFLFLAISVFLLFSLPIMLMPSKYTVYRYALLASFGLLVFVAAYFLINAASAPHLVKAKKYLAFVLPVWGLALLIASYADPSYLFSDFNHNLCILSVGMLTFFLLYEGCAAIGRISGAYLIFALLTAVTSMAYIVPNFILLAYWELSSEMNFIFEAAEIGAAGYTASVAFSLIRSFKPFEENIAEESACEAQTEAVSE